RRPAGPPRDAAGGGGVVKRGKAQPRPTGGDAVVRVSPPGAEVAMPLSARVAWKGHPGGEHGFGVEWKARDAGGTRRIKELVRRIEARGENFRRGTQPGQARSSA